LVQEKDSVEHVGGRAVSAGIMVSAILTDLLHGHRWKAPTLDARGPSGLDHTSPGARGLNSIRVTSHIQKAGLLSHTPPKISVKG